MNKKTEAAQTSKRHRAELVARSMRNHLPGTKHEVDGTHYFTQKTGAWFRLTKKDNESAAVHEARLAAAVRRSGGKVLA